jgi:hypothetical protein
MRRGVEIAEEGPMRIKHLFMTLICIVISLTSFSGAFAACRQEDCSEINEPGCTARAIRAYEDCRRRERIEREAREAAERGRRGQAGGDALKGADESGKASQTQYPFMDDIRQINKSDRKW